MIYLPVPMTLSLADINSNYNDVSSILPNTNVTLYIQRYEAILYKIQTSSNQIIII